MKKLKNQLTSVAKELAKLTQKVQALIGEVESLPAAPDVAPKTKAAAPKGKVAAKNPKKAGAKAAAKADTVLDSVFEVVRRSRNGATIAKLKEKTGLTPRQLSNALYKLSTRGKIVAKSRGLYIKK
jgi:predicted Rossmann fold nucleotide-binding protein DprA/Smf involved in DNA uptake